MTYSKGDLNAKSELALMGKCVCVSGETNIEYCLDYIRKVLNDDHMTGKEILAEATKFINPEETTPIGFVVNILMGEFKCVTIIFKDYGVPFKLDSECGVLCHVHNFTAPDCSELGYCFFKRIGNFYHRIG